MNVRKREARMLEEISIKNLGIIDKAVLPFSSGLTVITGETGAGKTMVLSGLHLLMGKRSDSSSIGSKGDTLSVEGVWKVKNSKLIEEIKDTGAELEDGQLFINRSVNSDGKSLSVLGGKRVPSGTLASISSQLINIHGQSDQNRLKSSQEQKVALDSFAGIKASQLKKECSEKYKEVRRITNLIKDIKENSFARIKEKEILEFFIKEFDDLAPEDNEIKELETLISTLSNIDEIKNSIQEVSLILEPEDDSFISSTQSIEMIKRILSKIENYDSEIEKLTSQANTALDALYVFQDSIEEYKNSLDSESLERLYDAQERVAKLKAFVKRNGGDLKEVISQREKAEVRIQELSQYDYPIEDLERELRKAEELLHEKAKELSALRKEKALELSTLVNAELSGLSMTGNTFIIEVKEVPVSSDGKDEINFMLAYPDQDPRSISKSASGGELSRIMLALEVVLANPEVTPTFIFDEVDSGVGGQTAIEIGKRLALLSQKAQVIVVTHLPQVAAFSDHHLKVLKTVDDNNVSTRVDELNDDEKISELTRMLSGLEDSDTGRIHARELRSIASSYKEERQNSL